MFIYSKKMNIIYCKFIEDDEYNPNHNWSVLGEFKNSKELLLFFNRCKEENIKRNESFFDIDSCCYIEKNGKSIEKYKISYYEKTYKKFLSTL